MSGNIRYIVTKREKKQKQVAVYKTVIHPSMIMYLMLGLKSYLVPVDLRLFHCSPVKLYKSN